MSDAYGGGPKGPPDPAAVGRHSRSAEEALVLLFSEKKTYGDLLTHAWLHRALGLPAPTTNVSVAEFQRRQFNYLGARSVFDRALLTRHNMALAADIGQGARIVQPSQQTEWAQSEFENDMRKSFSKAAARLKHVNADALTAEQKVENANALALLGQRRQTLRSRPANPFDQQPG